MEQNSTEWYEWRRKGIGSSDAPAIMKASPWTSPYMVWEEKRGIAEEKPRSLYILDKGHETETKARSIYEILHGVKAPPTLFVHPTFDFIRASCDGFIKAKNRVVEIKMQGKENHERTLEGQVPEKYLYQLMHQMLASGASNADFVSYCEDADKKLAVLNVERNEPIIQELLCEEREFWNLVELGKPPAFIELDFKKIRMKGKTKEIRELAECYRDLMSLKKQFKEKKAKFVSDLPGHPRLTLDGHRLYKTPSDFRIEFKDESAPSSGLPILGDLWNDQVRILPRIRGCNAHRVKHARARWKETPDKDYWIEVVKRLERSSFCTGQNNSQWKANFDFLIRPETHFKVMEGKYDDQIKTTTSIADILDD